MFKQIAASFIGAALAFALVGGVGYVTATSYFDNKFQVIEAVVNVSEEKIDKIFTAFSNGVTNLDDKVTDTKIYERFFGNKENEEPAN